MGFAVRSTISLCFQAISLLTAGMRGMSPNTFESILGSKWATCSNLDYLCSVHVRVSFPFPDWQAGGGIRDGLPLLQGAPPAPSDLLCQHLAFVTSCGLGSRKSALSKKVGVLVQLGQSAQSPFCVILGRLPRFFLECSWAWDGLWIFHVSWSGVGGDLGAGQVTCAYQQQDTHPGAYLLLTYSGAWAECIWGNKAGLPRECTAGAMRQCLVNAPRGEQGRLRSRVIAGGVA